VRDRDHERIDTMPAPDIDPAELARRRSGR
jgi:hypothetical protein